MNKPERTKPIDYKKIAKFFDKKITKKEAEDLIKWADNEIKEWQDFKKEVKRRFK